MVGSLAAAFLDSFEVAEFAAFFDDAPAWVLNDVLTISLGIFLDCVVFNEAGVEAGLAYIVRERESLARVVTGIAYDNA